MSLTVEGGAATAPLPSLAIAVLTFRRAADLAELLPLLQEQAAAVAAAGLADAHILVVDNDPDASARAQVEGFSPPGSGEVGVLEAAAAPNAKGASGALVYVHEPEPGITAARNRALTAAGHADLLVFIDDDERPSDEWLSALLRVQLATGCAAVAGPVVSTFERRPDAWITAGRYFERNTHQTGADLTVAATNNLLLDLRQIRRFGLAFDVTLGISGGGDTLFTRQIVAAGGRMLWAADAAVTDVVPRTRVTRHWVIVRAFRSGNSWSVTSLLLARTPLDRAAARAELTARGGARAGAGLLQIVGGLLTARLALRARGTRTLSRGFGMLAGAWGYRYHEYRRH